MILLLRWATPVLKFSMAKKENKKQTKLFENLLYVKYCATALKFSPSEKSHLSPRHPRRACVVKQILAVQEQPPLSQHPAHFDFLGNCLKSPSGSFAPCIPDKPYTGFLHPIMFFSSLLINHLFRLRKKSRPGLCSPWRQNISLNLDQNKPRDSIIS